MNDRALNVTSRLLTGVNNNCKTQPILFEILEAESNKSYSGKSRAIGVSTVCNLPLETDYQVFIGQDDTQSDVPIVAVDSKFMVNFTMLMIISW